MMSARRVRVAMLAALAAMLSPAAARATVVSTDASGFVVEHALIVKASPAQLWAVLVQPRLWWSPAHSWSGDASALSLEARAGGCFCERLANGGAVEHARVLFLKPYEMLRMSGALGPLQAEPVTGILTFSIKAPTAADDHVRLTVRYAVSGRSTTSLTMLAPLVDQVIGEQARRLTDRAAQADGL